MDKKLSKILFGLLVVIALNGGVRQAIAPIVENTITLVIPTVNAQAPPWADGFGKSATGGKGGEVKFITNLNNSGSGSLREALLASGDRILVFRVSGTINLTSSLTVNNGNVTIAGETAPGQGIQITFNNAWIQFQCSNVIIRHVRFRSSTGSSQSQLRLMANGEHQNIIIDHCSFAHPNPDEMAISIEGSGTGNIPQYSNITISNCIFGEAYRGVLQYKGHDHVTYYRNFFYSVYQRSPEANRPIYQNSNTISFEAINNLWHNSYHFTIQAQEGSRVTAIGNKRTGTSGVANSSATQLIDFNVGAGPSEGVPANSYLYANDNLNLIGPLYDGATASHLEGTRYQTSNITGDKILPVADINNMLPTIGAFWWNRDSHDQRFIDHYLNNTGSRGPFTGTPDNLDGGTAYTDTDNDGMEDSWETSNFGDLSQDNNDDDDSDGYTNLEEFLWHRAQDGESGGTGSAPYIILLGGSTINLVVGQDYVEYDATANDSEDGVLTDNIVITGSVDTDTVGTYYKYYNVEDSDGNDAEQLVRTIIVSPPPFTPGPSKGKWINKNVLFTLD